jgi:hypothetical protein
MRTADSGIQILSNIVQFDATCPKIGPESIQAEPQLFDCLGKIKADKSD